MTDGRMRMRRDVVKSVRRQVKRPGGVGALAKKGRQAVAEANGVAALKRVADGLSSVRKIVAEVTRKREDINEIGEVWLDAVCKGGNLLRKMAETGERAGDGDNLPTKVARRDPKPTLSDMDFTKSRASRWMMAASLPEKQRTAIIEEIKESPDGILTLESILTAEKFRRSEQKKYASVIPTEASIVLASCLDWLPTQPDCDLLLTDPPYSTDVEDIETFASAWLPVALAKVKRTGRAYVCIGAYSNELRAYLNVETPSHLTPPQVLVWTYRNTLGPSPTHDYKLNWQAILYYRGIDAAPLDCPLMTEQFSVQDINAPDGRQGDRWHAWQKPDELAERFVRHASRPNDLVLDPFAGTGTFILSAAKLGRVACGCEADPEMFKVAKRRGCRAG